MDNWMAPVVLYYNWIVKDAFAFFHEKIEYLFCDFNTKTVLETFSYQREWNIHVNLDNKNLIQIYCKNSDWSTFQIGIEV